MLPAPKDRGHGSLRSALSVVSRTPRRKYEEVIVEQDLHPQRGFRLELKRWTGSHGLEGVEV